MKALIILSIACEFIAGLEVDGAVLALNNGSTVMKSLQERLNIYQPGEINR